MTTAASIAKIYKLYGVSYFIAIEIRYKRLGIEISIGRWLVSIRISFKAN